MLFNGSFDYLFGVWLDALWHGSWRLARPSKGVNPWCSLLADHSAFTTSRSALPPRGIAPWPCLSPLLGDKFVEFSILEQLSHRANGEAQCGHR